MNDNSAFNSLLRDRLAQHESAFPDDMFERVMRDRDRKKGFAFWLQDFLKKNRWAVLLLALVFMSLLVVALFQNKKTHIARNTDKWVSQQKNEKNKAEKIPANPEKPAVSSATSSTTSSETVQGNKGKQVVRSKPLPALETRKKPYAKRLKKARVTQPPVLEAPQAAVATPESSDPTRVSGAEKTTEVLENEILTTKNKQQILLDKLALARADKVNCLRCELPDPRCPSPRGRGRKGLFSEPKFYVDAYVGPEYAQRRFKSGAENLSSVVAARDTTELTRFAVSTGLRTSVVFGSGLAFRVGVQYLQNNEAFRFDSGDVRVRTFVEVRRNPNGTIDTIAQTTEIIQGIFRRQRENRYRFFEIPVHVGYEIPVNRRLTLGVNAGVSFNIAAAYKVDYINLSLAPDSVRSGFGVANNVFKNQVGMSALASISVNYAVSKRFSLIFEPHFRHYLKPLNLPNYPIQQNYTFYGVQMGLRYRLNGDR
jgi:hypothetical protein